MVLRSTRPTVKPGYEDGRSRPPGAPGRVRGLVGALGAVLRAPCAFATAIGRSVSLPLRVSAVNLGGTDLLPVAHPLRRGSGVRWVGCEPLARWAAAIPAFPLTEVSGIDQGVKG